MKYLREFQTVKDYNEAKSTLDLPNVSLITATNGVYYKPVEPITIVYKGDNASATKIMTKTINAFGDTYTLDEASITKMTLDDNKVTLTDFNIANLGQYGGTYDVYTYTFNDANEHTLKVWTNSSDMFRLSPWFGGPSPSQSAFFSSIKSVVIPNTITTIGDSAFIDCTGLTSITIPNSVTSIGSDAFYGCESLTSIVIPNSVTSIGNSAFQDCTGLTSVIIGSGVTSIGQYAFDSCTGLTSIVVDSANTVYDSRDNCNAIVNTSTNKLIAGCKNTVIPNTVTSIGYRAFNNCSGLTSITIPDSVTSIGGSAFEDCEGLTSVTIGNSVTSIDSDAFRDCSSLTSITSNRTTAPAIQSDTFHNVKTGGTLTVPSGSTGYDVWMGNYYLGYYNWTKVEQ